MKTGIDTLKNMDFAPLRGRRVGLLSHLAAVDEDGRTTAEILHGAVDLVALFGPEHGFLGRQLAGEPTDSFEHPDWHIPVHSLYGATREPSDDALAGLDCIVCDLQDLGVRCYTYLATLRNMMRACERMGVEVVVLDRPVPLPFCVDGPVREAALDSFVAPLPVPFVYGMTLAEAARWIRAKLLPGVALATIPLDIPSRGAIALPAPPRFVPPSPGIRSPEAGMVYPTTVFTEAIPSIDCGLGTDLAFQVFGAPWLDARALCDALPRENFPGLRFEPCAFISARAYKGQRIEGARIVVQDRDAFRPFTAGMRLLAAIVAHGGSAATWGHPDTRPDWFDKLFGSPAPREALLAGAPFVCDDDAGYLASREAALLY